MNNNLLNLDLKPIEPNGLTVLIADDHPFYREGLKTVLQQVPSIKTICEAGNGIEVLSQINKQDISLVFLDIDMPELSGLEALRELRITNKNIRVVMLSMFCAPKHVMQAYDYKANGYLLKEADIDEVELCISEVLKGNSYYCEKAAENVLQAMKLRYDQSTNLSQDQSPTELSPREIDVLKLLCKEYTNKEVAAQLKITEYTVKGHRDKIKSKLNCHNLAGMMEYAIKKGYHVLGI